MLYKNYSSNEKHHWMSQLNILLAKHLHDPLLTNAFLASQLGISERTFYLKVKRAIDKTPNQYIRQLRLEKAHDLLTSGNFYIVKEVLPLTGFIKVGYFYKVFRLSLIHI